MKSRLRKISLQRNRVQKSPYSLERPGEGRSSEYGLCQLGDEAVEGSFSHTCRERESAYNSARSVYNSQNLSWFVCCVDREICHCVSLLNCFKKIYFSKKPESELFGCPHSPKSPLWEGFQANLFKPSNTMLHGFQSRCSFYASAGVVFV